MTARERQRRRYRDLGYVCNAHLPGPLARREAGLAPDAHTMLAGAVDQMALTGRGFDRVVKVARTIADLEGVADVQAAHVVEALSYRTAFEPEGLPRAG
jgi:magnesium chelatase family protein